MSIRNLQWQPEAAHLETRKTFVLWLSRDSERPALEGRLEDVDTGREFRFRSAEELMALLENWASQDE